jgi:hypothetical protein
MHCQFKLLNHHLFFIIFSGEDFDVAGFDYDEDEYGDFEGNKTSSKTTPSTKTTEKPKTTEKSKTTEKPPKAKPSTPIAKPRQDFRPKRLVRVRRIGRRDSFDPKFLQLVIDDNY